MLPKVKDRNNTVTEMTFGRWSFIPFQKKYSHKDDFLTLPKSPQITARKTAFATARNKTEEPVLREPREGTSKFPKASLYSLWGNRWPGWLILRKNCKYIYLKI